MNVKLEVDYLIEKDVPDHVYVPEESLVKNCIEKALVEINYDKPAQVSVCIVNVQKITELNEQYRDMSKPTNVLSFPYEAMPGVDVPLLGDIVICAEVVSEEAKLYKKNLQQHWAHMLVHGALHLLGYDHISDSDAHTMQSLETSVLSHLGFSNPYGVINTP